MVAITSEDTEKNREIAREKREAVKRRADGLTCPEAEVEAILSEGEST